MTDEATKTAFTKFFYRVLGRFRWGFLRVSLIFFGVLLVCDFFFTVFFLRGFIGVVYGLFKVDYGGDCGPTGFLRIFVGVW